VNARRPLLEFFSITYLVTWILWGVAALILRTGALSPLAQALLLLGTISPSLVALALSTKREGRAGRRALIDRVFTWEVGARWYLFAIGYMAAIKLSAALVHRVATGAWPRFGDEPWYLMVGAILISTWVQAGEEIGWRGYALPRLSERFGLAPASIMLGIIWALWHLPLFFFAAADTYGQSFLLYALQVTALSVALAWLYWRTGGSLLLVMLMHASVNNTKDIVPSVVPGATDPFALNMSLVAWLALALMWTAAAYFLFRMRNISALSIPEAKMSS
jgi:membrane protease YdiL (CAAX protease family)